MGYRIRPASLIALSSLLLSCGGASTNPCSLVTSHEAERALGEPVEEAAQLDAKTCVIHARGTKGNAVTIQVTDASGTEQRAWFNKERLRRDSHLIAGLGEGAIRIDAPSLSRLTFLHKDVLVTVIVASTTHHSLHESVTVLAKSVAAHSGASTVVAVDPPSTHASLDPLPDRMTRTDTTMRPAPVTSTQTHPTSLGPSTGPKKSEPIDPTSLTGTWQARTTKGTAHYDMLLTIRPNLEWSLSSMMQFDGVMNAEAGLWSLERANTFRGLGWKGTYRKSTPKSFSSTGSIQATWARLEDDQDPKHIPVELWKQRHEATSVPVFQLKSVDPDLVGQWEASGTYAGGKALFVWSIKPSAASDLLIVETIRGTVKTKDGLPQLRPHQKHPISVNIITSNDGGFTTSDGKTTLHWVKLLPDQGPHPQL